LLRYSFHKKNHLPEHHALYDAQAARYAFRERPPFIAMFEELGAKVNQEKFNEICVIGR
jgi:hypothetical protein